MSKLAILGGTKLREKPFPAYNTIGKEEEEAVLRVLRSGKLSTYLGSWHDDFYGGVEVQSLEKEWATFFNSKHAISVNSATSGLYCAIGAAGINPGDEVIVSPYTMSASATAIIAYGGIPVFADVEKDLFCLDIESVEKNITNKTKAIMVVDIFGQPYNSIEINKLAKKHNLIVIEDTAQAPGAKSEGKYAGTLGDIGIFSLNYHKHIHSGEGGVIVTDNDEFAWKMRLIRNHAEAVISAKGYEDKKELNNMVGFNYRMTELEAAISREQLKKLPALLEQRISNVNFLNEKLSSLPFLSIPKVRKNSTHAYYLHSIKYDQTVTEVPRNKFVDAVKAELPPTLLREDSPVLLNYGYVKPIYLMPMYKERIAFGEHPFNLTDREYKKGDCPNCEELHFETLIVNELIRPPMSQEDLTDVYLAFEKVWKNIDQLK
ncbi:MAG: DegT/DnrJ/EryC1/StrS aminotransferase [Halobacteriovorax sp.]|nr:DegT/DnrJ/EryC1/StrS aminotransferase [Halobacteriovorax sp.]|tara:strand:+ start:4343 stop:5638 length:1296 start_codon:yes stop_codon:yes gene_type:complete